MHKKGEKVMTATNMCSNFGCFRCSPPPHPHLKLIPEFFRTSLVKVPINTVIIILKHKGRQQSKAWCISDHETTEIDELFLHTIKNQAPISTVSVLMTDDVFCSNSSLLSIVHYNIQYKAKITQIRFNIKLTNTQAKQ